MSLPRGDLAAQGVEVGDATVEALAVERAQLDLGDVQPASVLGSVVDFEALGQALGFSRRKGLVERGDVVGVEVVDDKAHLDRLRIAFDQHALDEVRPIFAGAALGDLDVSAPRQRFDLDQKRSHAVAHILVIHRRHVSGGERQRAATSPTSCLLDSSMHTTGKRGS